jgi:hypothetical protein
VVETLFALTIVVVPGRFGRATGISAEFERSQSVHPAALQKGTMVNFGEGTKGIFIVSSVFYNAQSHRFHASLEIVPVKWFEEYGETFENGLERLEVRIKECEREGWLRAFPLGQSWSGYFDILAE